MHEQAVMRDLVGHITSVATSERATRVTRVSVELGALSHFTTDHFREHFVDATRGTLAAGAEVDAVLAADPTAARAQDVVLLEIELELP